MLEIYIKKNEVWESETRNEQPPIETVLSEGKTKRTDMYERPTSEREKHDMLTTEVRYMGVECYTSAAGPRQASACFAHAAAFPR
jgi:hypothetical protein